jgi:hypothetical protein
MSETTQQPPAEQPYVPSESLAMEEGEDATQPLQQPQERAAAVDANGADGDKPEPTEAEQEEDRKRTERRREAQRIGYLTKQRYAEKARADALEQRLQQYEQQQNGGQPPQLTREQFEQMVETRAAQKLAEEQQSQRFHEWDEGGRKQFGRQPFIDACNTVAAMASDEQRQILRDVAMDTEGGARAIMELAENAEEAERILALPPHRMALAIAKLGADAKPAPTLAPPRVSNVPAPIRPPAAGRARGAADPESGNMDNYMQWSAKQNWRR